MDNNALKNEFLLESLENLSSINEDFPLLEKDPSNKDLLNKIYRTVHTMKGSAGFLGYTNLQELTHAAENLLDELREDNIIITTEMIDTLLETFDVCSLIVKTIEATDSEGDTSIKDIKNKLDSFVIAKNNDNDNDSSIEHIDGPQNPEEENVSAAAMESLKELIGEGKIDESVLTQINSKIPSTDDEKLIDDTISSAAMDSLKELIDEGKLDQSALEEIQETSESTQTQTHTLMPTNVTSEIAIGNTVNIHPVEGKSIVDSFVRVNVSVLDKIMNVVGELVLNRNQIVQFSNQENNHELTKLSQHLNMITSELQSEVMSTRMQPIASILTQFERLVRDFSRTSGKNILLKLSGQDTELDKTLIEAIKDPLVHIVRNACDHGIETVEHRTSIDKTPSGTIWIKAYNESGQVTIEIVDDGRGLDKNKIAQKAIEKGIITSEEQLKMKDSQIFSLIFAPGFSTAEKVTSISGRGVGMDIVKTNIEKIGGSVSVQSSFGEGTTFKLRIPLTLAIVPALIIKSMGEFFAVPQLNLVELVRLESDEDKKLIEKIQGSEFLKLRGKLTPVFRLNDVLKLEEVNKKTEQLNSINSIIEELSSKEDRITYSAGLEHTIFAENIIILSAEERFFGIIVDEILDTEEIVVKPLSKNLKYLNLFGGATIMGDGKVALILDALGFLNKVSDAKERVKLKEEHYGHDETEQRLEAPGEMQENLLFKLGDQRTYAIPLQLVARLEEFSVSKVEKTGNQPIVRYLNAPIPLINIEKTLNLKGQSALERKNQEDIKALSCIVTTIRGKNYGIVVDEILDISIDHANIDTTAVDREGILGTIFINNKTISLIDIYSIIEAQAFGIKPTQTKEQKVRNKSKRILLVDDSAMYRKMEADALVEHGYRVDVANNGEHGFQILEKNSYDLLITDIEMPVLDGFELATKVRSESNKKDIKIVALSTRSSQADKEKGIECGFDYHIEKFKKDEVIDLVDAILNGE